MIYNAPSLAINNQLWSWLIILSSLCLPSYCIGQINLSGQVLDEDGQALGFANLSLYRVGEASLHKGDITDVDGTFNLKIEQAGGYVLKVQYLAYAPWEKELFLDQDLDLEPIILQQAANELEEVVVRAERPVLEQKEDKIWFNIASSPLNSGFDGMEVLSRSPNIWVEEEGILIRNAPAMILINGRPLRLTGAELTSYLEGLNSSNIQRIEIQTNPSANSDADNEGGTINIVLKEAPKGINGSWQSNYMYRGPKSRVLSSRLNFNYGSKGWNLYGSYQYLINLRNPREISSTDYFETGNFLSNHQIGLDSFYRHNYRLGLVVEPSAKHLLGLEVFGNYSDFNFLQDNQLQLTNAGELLEEGQTIFEGFRDLAVFSASFNYRWKLDTTGTNLQVFGDYLDQDIHWFNRATTGYDIGLFVDNQERNFSDNLTKIYGWQADLEKPFANGIKTGFGLKWTQTRRDNILLSEFFLQENWESNDRSNAFNYREDISAAYLSVDKELGANYYLKLGLRSEWTNLEKLDLTNEDLIEQDYLNWFPSMFLSRTLSPKNSLSLSYVKRIRRPPFNFLNNTVRKFNDFRFELGNPNLGPEFRHRLELQAKLGKQTIALYYRQTDDAINGIYFLEGEVAFYQKFNEGSQSQWGLEYNWTGDVNEWLNLRASAQAFRRQFIDATGRKLFRQNTIRLRVDGTIKINSTTNLEFRANHYSPQADAYYIRQPLNEVRLMLQKQFFAKKLTTRIYVADLFNSLVFANERPFDTFVTRASWKPHTRTINFWVAYNFSSQHKVKGRKVRSQNEARSRL